MSEILRLSVSKVKTFQSCKLKYKYLYLDKRQRKEFDFYTFGKFCHKVLEDFHKIYINGDDPPLNKSMSVCYKNALSEFSLTNDMKAECRIIIDKYLQQISKNKSSIKNVLACEKNFDFHVSNNVSLNGMIDKIQIDDDDVIHLIDYKSTKNKRYLENDWFQLLTYAYTIYLEDPNLEKIRASYVLLRHDFEHITKEFNIKEVLEVKDKYLQYADEIMKEKEYKANPTSLCSFCDCYDICPSGGSGFSKYGEVNW